MSNPAIIVVAHNRPASLRRLLTSIAKGNYAVQNIPLHISIDRSDVNEVEEIAKDFIWEHGEKVVQISEDRLGLKNHILQCGDLTERYGSIIVLEDDLLVSPFFYEYAQKGLEFYSGEFKVAGISLYSYEVAESCGYPFNAIKDDSDVYFMQVASSWGQAWSREQWIDFRTWLKKHGDDKLQLLPNYIQQWGDRSWKKYFINYLIDVDRYFVFPQFSLSTNFEDAGSNAVTVDLYQVEVESSQRACKFSTFEESKSIYDAYFEPSPITLSQHTSELESFDYSIDIYGQKRKEDIDTKYVLTTRSGHHAERQFSSQMHPLLNNVIFDVAGMGINLFSAENVEWDSSNPAEFYSKSLVQKLRDESGKFDSFSIVVPILELDEAALNATLSSLPLFDARVQIILVCVESLKMEVEQLELIKIHQLKIVGSSASIEKDVLDDGLKFVTNEIVTWCRQGSRMASDAISMVANIFGNYRQLYWLVGVKPIADEQDYHRINTANYRWNRSMLDQYSKRAANLSTELTFWRRSIYERAKHKQEGNVENMFSALLSEVELTVVCYNFGKSISVSSRVSHHNTVEIKKSMKSLKKRIFGRPSYFFFRSNTPALRFIFVELEHLPNVLRFDADNGTFFSARY